ncbi:hypothetical protein M9H77_34276 [Catharanthus roseus]|uniref:Uncharacterized protein n=1 Tax=Catharanthus roseus TaxID=4058 RepID=A0ACB9ZLX9_CATRO|nr:hypothetical protein M9H77_34276 [Catharanthus roseus]
MKRRSREGEEERLHKKRGGRALKRGSQILEISRIQTRLGFSFSKGKKTEGKTQNKHRHKNWRQAVSTNKTETKNRRNSKQKPMASRAEVIIIKLKELKGGERRLHWPDLRKSSDPKDC